jgi:hypothetical protein
VTILLNDIALFILLAQHVPNLVWVQRARGLVVAVLLKVFCELKVRFLVSPQVRSLLSILARVEQAHGINVDVDDVLLLVWVFRDLEAKLCSIPDVPGSNSIVLKEFVLRHSLLLGQI